MLNYSFYQDVEKPLKFVKYSDTDSLYINVPSIKLKSVEDGVKKAFEIGKLINDAIANYVNNELIVKMGITPDNNSIDFKTECLMGNFMLLPIKKNYAYKLLAKEGNILKEPEISYTGIPVIRTDSPKFTQSFIRDIIEKNALADIDDSVKLQHLNNLLAAKKEELLNHIENFNISIIGSPKKWGSGNYKKEPQQVVSMKLWNTITNTKYFTPVGSGLSIPINIINEFDFEQKIKPLRFANDYTLKDINFNNLTALVIPYKYNCNELKELFESFYIKIDSEKCWDLTYDTVSKRIVKVIVNSIKKN